MGLTRSDWSDCDQEIFRIALAGSLTHGRRTMQIRKVSIIASTVLLLTTAYAAEPKSNPPSGGTSPAAAASAQETVKLAVSGMT